MKNPRLKSSNYSLSFQSTILVKFWQLSKCYIKKPSSNFVEIMNLFYSKIQWEHNGQIIGSDFIIQNRYKRSENSIEPDYGSESTENYNEIDQPKFENLDTNENGDIVPFTRYERNTDFIDSIPLLRENRSVEAENYQNFLKSNQNAENLQNTVIYKNIDFISDIPLTRKARHQNSEKDHNYINSAEHYPISDNYPLMREKRSPESENDFTRSVENKRSVLFDDFNLIMIKRIPESEKDQKTFKSVRTETKMNYLFNNIISLAREKRSHVSENDITNNETTESNYQRPSKFDHLKRSKRSYASNQNGVLIIENVNSDDSEGLYTCSVSNTNGEMARRAFELIVMEPPVIDPISFGQDLQEGQIAQATCSIRGGDTPIFFTWLKDGLPILANLKVSNLFLIFISLFFTVLSCFIQMLSVLRCILVLEFRR